MTDVKNEEKPKKLSFGTAGKLSLNRRSFETPNVKTFSSGKSGIVVEVRKSATVPQKLSLRDAVFKDSYEEDKKLDLLKKAAGESRSAEGKVKYTTLSEFAEMNKNKAKEIFSTETEKIEEDKILGEKREGEKQKHSYREQDLSGEEEAGLKKKTGDSKHPVKAKSEEPKKLKKSDIFHMLDGNEEIASKSRSLASLRRARDKEKRKSLVQKQEKIYREIIIPETISVGELASRMSERVADVIKELMKLGVIAGAGQYIDADTAEIVTAGLGHSFKRTQESDVENILIQAPDAEENLTKRPPVVTIMGHVDHGKTSLLDALRSTDVASSESGGITQSIGAYKVSLPNGESITFLDTPGHEAFAGMRIRGAKITDMVVLVVAADDGINTQTIEAINHAKAAKVPIIVALNKIDKPDVNIEKVKNELLIYELVPEDLGGEVMVVPVSALKKIGLDKLEEAISLTAEMADLKANPYAPASGVVIESKIVKNEGVAATLLVQRGTVKKGDLVVAGSSFGRVKKMLDDKLNEISEASLSVPVEIFGLDSAPYAGDKFDVVENEKQAKDITEYRKRIEKEKKLSLAKKVSVTDLFQKAAEGVPSVRELNVIVKGDLQGSVEAIIASLSKIGHEEATVRIIHSAAGAVNESDVLLAKTSGALILCFNVRPSSGASSLAAKEKVEIKTYSIIYELIGDIEAIVNDMSSPIIKENYIGSVDIRQIFNITKIGTIAGSYVTKGLAKRGAKVKLIREDIVIYEGKIATLKRFKDDVKEVKEGFECGIEIENYKDLKVNDKLEVYEITEEKRKFS